MGEFRTLNAKIFFKKINWRIVFLHLLSTILIILGAKQFSKFYDFEIAEYFSKYSLEEIMSVHLNQTDCQLVII